MKTQNYASPIFTAASFAVISFAFFVVTGCSADSSIAGATDEPVVTAEAVNMGAPSKAVASDDGIHGTMTDPRDGQVYKVVKIGEQWWMAENLNYEAEGSACYSLRSGECETRGRYYDWQTAMDIKGKTSQPTYPVRGVCPADWHLPTAEEWRTLIHVVGQSESSYALKANYGWAPGFEGADKFGFTALPEGEIHSGDVWLHGVDARFWASSEDEDEFGQTAAIYDDMAEVRMELILKSRMVQLTVRCVHD